MAVRLEARQLNRATLARQLLLERAPLDAAEAVRRIVAVQAQEPASPYVALWNRVAGFDAADLDAAYAEERVVKATLLRTTLHAVHVDDLPAFHAALVPSLRRSRLGDRRFAACGLTAGELDELVPDLLRFLHEPRTNQEAEAWLAARHGRPVPEAWWALRTCAPLVHVATGGPWSHGRRPSRRAAPLPADPVDPHEAAVLLVRRCLEGFGPMTAGDLGQLTILRMPAVRSALADVAGLRTFEGPGGERLHDVEGAPVPDGDVPAPPRLMAMWDSTLLAYADRSRVLPHEHRPHVIRRNGDVLPTVLVDGRVAGAWRPTPDGVEVTAFERLDEEAWAGLEAEAEALRAFLADREPLAYARFGRWWSTLPAVEVRALG